MHIVECPRDAMQGIKTFISTDTKVRYLNQLLKAGFPTLDFGSFVSPKAVPQMKDTAEVVEKLDVENSRSKLLAIVANKRGADDAVKFDQISYLGYPFSVSETFQQRNANSTIEESLKRVEEIQNICKTNDKILVVYLSMAFGNPYGDPWNPDIVTEWGKRLHNELEVPILALSDTIGSSSRETIKPLFETMLAELPSAEIGAHLHTTPKSWREKVQAAYSAGCRRFDGALGGWGGCPMAKDELTGNMPTESILQFAEEHGEQTHVDQEAVIEARGMLHHVFNA